MASVNSEVIKLTMMDTLEYSCINHDSAIS